MAVFTLKEFKHWVTSEVSPSIRKNKKDGKGYHELNSVCIKASDAVAGAIEENRRVVIA